MPSRFIGQDTSFSLHDNLLRTFVLWLYQPKTLTFLEYTYMSKSCKYMYSLDKIKKANVWSHKCHISEEGIQCHFILFLSLVNKTCRKCLGNVMLSIFCTYWTAIDSAKCLLPSDLRSFYVYGNVQSKYFHYSEETFCSKLMNSGLKSVDTQMNLCM